MSNLKLIPISRADHETLSRLMDEEERAWFSELAWDYAPVRQILTSCMYQDLLPGFLALDGLKGIGYGYFLTHLSKGIIGTVYLPKGESQQEAADEILAQMIRSLKEHGQISRIESQILPFHNLNLTAAFTRHGFECFPRYFLELDLLAPLPQKEPTLTDRVVPWDSSYLQGSAGVAQRSYENEPDALICEDYCSESGCESYLRSLVENPGCGIFQPEASFVGLDNLGKPCGFIISSRTSAFAGMVPQIAIHPSHQGRGLGGSLIHHALARMKAVGMRTVSLTVTKKNRRAFEWYQRMGFKIRKEFNAYVWLRG